MFLPASSPPIPPTNPPPIPPIAPPIAVPSGPTKDPIVAPASAPAVAPASAPAMRPPIEPTFSPALSLLIPAKSNIAKADPTYGTAFPIPLNAFPSLEESFPSDFKPPNQFFNFEPEVRGALSPDVPPCRLLITSPGTFSVLFGAFVGLFFFLYVFLFLVPGLLPLPSQQPQQQFPPVLRLRTLLSVSEFSPESSFFWGPRILSMILSKTSFFSFSNNLSLKRSKKAFPISLSVSLIHGQADFVHQSFSHPLIFPTQPGFWSELLSEPLSEDLSDSFFVFSLLIGLSFLLILSDTFVLTTTFT
ncbi:hypothetical protein UM89_03075 [Bacillus subtilis]|nr:hypothetical protein UM89_03075 [Bacillus subtilis]